MGNFVTAYIARLIWIAYLSLDNVGIFWIKHMPCQMGSTVCQSCGKAKISVWLGADRYLHIYFTISKYVHIVVSTSIFIKLSLTDHAELLMVQIQSNLNHLRVTREFCWWNGKLESSKCCLSYYKVARMLLLLMQGLAQGWEMKHIFS